MNAIAEPKLAAPGAGLPRIELLIARLLFAWRNAFATRESCNILFQRERELIQKLVQPLGSDSASRRLLIARCRGLEDSSRYWSVWMTLDHLRIVHGQMSRVIRALTRGITPPGSASTAAVKPSPDVTAAVVAEYEDSCDNLLKTIDESPRLKTEQTYTHPWFGPLNAAGWHTLSGGHLRIHRIQIERIVAGLGEVQR